jgi:hypothetical protein
MWDRSIIKLLLQILANAVSEEKSSSENAVFLCECKLYYLEKFIQNCFVKA